MMPVRLKIAIKAAGFAAVAGSFLSTILFCLYIAVNMTGGRSAAGYATIPGIGIIAGILGFIAALPTALILGIPIVWLWGRRFAASPILSSILLAVIGAGLGRWMFFLFFDSGLGAFIDPARYACPTFGAVVAGLHPILAAWLYQDKDGASA
jgi:hypothetical protein